MILTVNYFFKLNVNKILFPHKSTAYNKLTTGIDCKHQSEYNIT